ncbi:hypothetical protein [Streptomyces sp. NPDC057910]
MARVDATYDDAAEQIEAILATLDRIRAASPPWTTPGCSAR